MDEHEELLGADYAEHNIHHPDVGVTRGGWAGGPAALFAQRAPLTFMIHGALRRNRFSRVSAIREICFWRNGD